eukprot:m.58542 g.58542  ORF g.58542 m.58542 type:complete len:181 (-) comp11267_c0_seq1:132-674(-)
MLKSLGRRFSKGRNHAKKEGKKMPRPSIGGDELVLQTNEIGLNGVVDDEGNSTAMAITGCGSAWTKSFNIKNAATTKLCPIVESRKISTDSLQLDVALFEGDGAMQQDNNKKEEAKPQATNEDGEEQESNNIEDDGDNKRNFEDEDDGVYQEGEEDEDDEDDDIYNRAVEDVGAMTLCVD